MIMSNQDLKNYPQILKIEDDGKIIALDKNGRVNTELNTHTLLTIVKNIEYLADYYMMIIAEIA